MKIVNDTDTIERIDDTGDKLILLAYPRQEDVDRCEELEQDVAFEKLGLLKKAGVVADDAIQEAKNSSPDELTKAKAAASKMTGDAPKIRAHRLKSLAVKLVVDGTAIGGAGILDAYKKMNPQSARWVDEQVADVWGSALPSEAEKNSEGAPPAVPPSAAGSATNERPGASA